VFRQAIPAMKAFAFVNLSTLEIVYQGCGEILRNSVICQCIPIEKQKSKKARNQRTSTKLLCVE
jgi:hypothetical protein